MELHFLENGPLDNGTAVLTGSEARHISKVLRHRAGERLFVTDGRGTEYELELTAVEPERVAGNVVNRRSRPRETGHRVVLAQGVVKGGHMAEIVGAVTQLGVSQVVPVGMARSVAGLGRSRLARLRSVAVEAVKCSTRTVVPEVAEPATVAELAAMVADHDQALLAYVDERETGLAEVCDRTAGSTLLMIGPEGGFAPEEVEQLRAAGARSFTMGPRRMRAEVAAVAAVANVMQLLGEMEGEGSKAKDERRCC